MKIKKKVEAEAKPVSTVLDGVFQVDWEREGRLCWFTCRAVDQVGTTGI